MAKKMVLRAHPRLYMGAEEMARVQKVPQSAVLQSAADRVKKDARHFAKMPALTYPRNVHNEHLLRAREVQTRVMNLLVRWAQTKQEMLRLAILDYVKMMDSWQYWSWMTWRQENDDPNAIFDLSYGENSVTLALVYDWLYDTLSSEEKALVVDVAQRRALGPYVHHVEHKQWPNWYEFKNNWNAVCSGGGGILAWAMYEDLPEAKKAVKIVERVLPNFVETVKEGGGGWVEGTGYWNYGMCYAFRYMMSYENATGQVHPLMRSKILKKTMSFPFDFFPEGHSCSFGDNNRWSPLPFHYAAAKRFGLPEVVRELDACLLRQKGNWSGRSNAAEWLALHAGEIDEKQEPLAGREAKLYKGLDWGILSDKDQKPHLHLAFRGGTTLVPHSNRDLLSFHCVVGGEKFVASLSPVEYLDTTGSERRPEIFENGPFSKNTILINGVGIAQGSSLERTEMVSHDGILGVRMVATEAMGEMRDGPAAKFCGRLILMLAERVYVIVDRALLPHVGRVESRMHTFAQVKPMKTGAVLKSNSQFLRVAYACNQPAVFTTGVDAPTKPTDEASSLLRWCIQDQHKDVTMATVLSPGKSSVKVNVTERGHQIVVQVAGRNWERDIVLSKQLKMAKR